MSIKITSIFCQPIRQLIGTSQSLIPYQRNTNIQLIYQLTNCQKESFKNFKSISKEFWKQKYIQCLELEKSRLIIDDIEYLINARDGFLGELL